jgi:hypothetical protein
MPHSPEEELNLGFSSPPKPKPALVITSAPEKSLSPAQIEFNKRLKALERARAAFAKEKARLDHDLQICITQLLPLLEKKNRAERDLLFDAVSARNAIKLTPRRKKGLDDLLSTKASVLLADPSGLSEDDIKRLDSIVQELGLSRAKAEDDENVQSEFNEMRAMIESMAELAGINLDLGDLDPKMDPSEFERIVHERMAALDSDTPFERPNTKAKRKPSKAALEREKRQREVEDAKTKDFKTLYKQLAKALHPDLETDPALKAKRQLWMQRLTTARDNGDLRDMLAIEMEWIGSEFSNLTQASDEKLRTYSLVLKEQIEDTKQQADGLIFQPQYQFLQRFLPPFGRHLLPDFRIREFHDSISQLQNMNSILIAGGDAARKMIKSWADEHARYSGF